jgi:hypothetical protein
LALTPGLLPGSLFNPRGVGNVDGGDHLWDVLGPTNTTLDDRSPRLAPTSTLVRDPSTVATADTATSGAASVRDIVLNHIGAPRTAEVVAAKLAELYGPYTAANSEENRRAIIENLRWITDTNQGTTYNDARASSGTIMTQSPNVTVSTRSGVCRDIHTAAQAVLASLMNARQVNGHWVPGAPTGQEGNVQTIAFDNPSEYHAYMVYRDPATGRWNALEYDKSYQLESGNAVDAFRSLPGYVSGYMRYAITGWNTAPRAMDRGAVGADAARAFFRLDPGTGTPGEIRLLGGNRGMSVAGFLTPGLSIVGSMSPSEMQNSLDGGLKLNYHRDFDRGAILGYTRVAGGVYTSSFDASVNTGDRALADRATYRTWIFGFQADGRLETRPRQFLGEHLMGRIGGDFDFLLGVPLAGSGPSIDRVAYLPAALDYSNFRLGLDGTLSGREHLSPQLTFDWALRARYDLDVINAGLELATSGGTSARNLSLAPLRTDFALALTHTGDSVTTRFEAGGTQYWAAPFDGETTPSMLHHAALTISPRSGLVNFGILARGEVLNGTFVPVDSIGVALNITPSRNVSIGAGVTASSPDGRMSTIGENITVNGNLNLRF